MGGTESSHSQQLSSLDLVLWNQEPVLGSLPHRPTTAPLLRKEQQSEQCQEAWLSWAQSPLLFGEPPGAPHFPQPLFFPLGSAGTEEASEEQTKRTGNRRIWLIRSPMGVVTGSFKDRQLRKTFFPRSFLKEPVCKGW